MLVSLVLAVLLFSSMAGAVAQESEDSQTYPLDLTITLTRDDESSTETPTPEAETETETATPASLGTGLRLRDPSSVRVASIGVELGSVDTLDRLMWGNSQASTVLQLYRLLPKRVASPILQDRVQHILLSRAVPPQDSLDLAEELLFARLELLRDNAEVTPSVAEIIRALPDDETWQELKEWLLFHDLITRNDEAACGYAFERSATSLELRWHQIRVFCQVIRDDLSSASFALDILADSGVDDALYFALMRNLVNGGGEAQIPQDSSGSLLNLVLMDTAKVSIPLSALEVAAAHEGSLSSVRYLSEEASIWLEARSFANNTLSASDISAAWKLLPSSGVSFSEALAQLMVAETDEEALLPRLHAWQAVSAERDSGTASRLAMSALKSDYRFGGAKSLALWLPFINESDSSFLHALIQTDNRNLRSEEDLAWAEMMRFSARPIASSSVAIADAFDAVPLLQASGIRVEPIDWQAHFNQANNPLASGEVALAMPRLEVLKASANTGNKAETLLLTALALGETKLHLLSREDATQLVTALSQVGLSETAQELAREILTAWALHRHFSKDEDNLNPNASS